MILLSFVLVVVSATALGFGVFQTSDPLVWTSLVAGLGAVALIVGSVLRRRRELVPVGADAAGPDNAGSVAIGSASAGGAPAPSPAPARSGSTTASPTTDPVSPPGPWAGAPSRTWPWATSPPGGGPPGGSLPGGAPAAGSRSGWTGPVPDTRPAGATRARSADESATTPPAAGTGTSPSADGSANTPPANTPPANRSGTSRRGDGSGISSADGPPGSSVDRPADPWTATPTADGSADPWSATPAADSSADPWSATPAADGSADPWSATPPADASADPWSGSPAADNSADPWSGSRPADGSDERRHPAQDAAPPFADGAAAAAGGDGEPGIERVTVRDALRVAQLADEVVVVDGHPRYHLAGCPTLTGAGTTPLAISVARRAGFTPCAVCGPDTTFLTRLRSRTGDGPAAG